MGRRVQIEPGAFYLLAAWLLMLPLRWCAAAMVAAAIHELFHFLAVTAVGGSVIRVRIGCRGAVMETSPMEPKMQALCAAAGPCGSFFLLLTAGCCPELGVCAAVQGLFNLIPIYPLDGGRVLSCLLPEEVCAAVSCFAVIFLSGLCGWLFVRTGMGVFCFLMVLPIGILWYQRKIPCKEPKLPLQ